MSVGLGRFKERSGELPTTQFAYRKDLVIYYALLCMSHVPYTAKCIGEWAARLGLCRLILAQAFYKVNHQGILYKLCSVGIGSSFVNTDTVFYLIDHSTLW